MADHRFYFWAQRDLAGLRLKSFDPLVLITVIVHRSYNIRFRFVGASIWNICVAISDTSNHFVDRFTFKPS